MKPAPFHYLRIEHPDEAVEALAQHGEEARVLAGGQSLMPILNMRLAQPRLLIDISRCVALGPVHVDGERLVVGAAVTQSGLERRSSLRMEASLLAQTLPHIAHEQIRNRGTICGSIAHADPSAELPLCLTALRGDVVLRSVRGERTVPAEDFFQGALLTDRRADELVVAARFPLLPETAGTAFEEFSLRHGDYAIVAVAAVSTPQGLRLCVGGAAERASAVDLPAGIGGSALDDALNEFAWQLQAHDDAQASAAMRRHLVRQLGRRVAERARNAHDDARRAEGQRPPAPRSHARTVPGSGTFTGANAAGTATSPRAARLDTGTTRRVSMRINAQARTGEVESRTLLSDFLRHELGLTGTHVGCEHGVCGACTVRIDGQAQRACLTLAVQAEGRSLQTVECTDAEDAVLQRLRTAFRRHHALQCGYCTAGILMSSLDLLAREPAADEARVRAMLAGHLCRCTGYTPIVTAVLEAAASTAEPHV